MSFVSSNRTSFYILLGCLALYLLLSLFYTEKSEQKDQKPVIQQPVQNDSLPD